MIYFELYNRGVSGLNNGVISYVLGVSLSQYFEREIYFEHEKPSDTPPYFIFKEEYKKKFEILSTSKRSLVSDLIVNPVNRAANIQDSENSFRCENPMASFLTTAEMRAKYENTMIWRFFSLGRQALIVEDLQQFARLEFGANSMVNQSYFYFLDKAEKAWVLNQTKIEYRPEIESFAARIAQQFGEFYAIHLRLGDFFDYYKDDGFAVEIERYRNYVNANFPDKNLPVLIATDGLHEKDFFAVLFQNYNYVFIDELIFDDYSTDFAALEWTDFNVLTVLNQLLCTTAQDFIGTYRSSLTTIIHRLRQERSGQTTFNFFPDDKVAKLLTPDFKIKPDRNGFFDWNRYSVFSEFNNHPGCMREWDFNLTALNL